MTIVDAPTHRPVVDEAQLLFEEARQRRKRRWLISGVVTLIVMVLLSATALVATIGGGTTAPKPVSSPVPITGASASVAAFSVRPVLCYAPPLAASSRSTCSYRNAAELRSVIPVVARQSGRRPESGQRQRLHGEDLHSAGSSVRFVCVNAAIRRQCRQCRAAAGSPVARRRALCAGPGRVLRLRDQVGPSGGAKWSMGGRPCAHQRRVGAMGRTGSPAVPCHARDRRSWHRDISPDHTAHAVEFQLLRRPGPNIRGLHQAGSEGVGRPALERAPGVGPPGCRLQWSGDLNRPSSCRGTSTDLRAVGGPQPTFELSGDLNRPSSCRGTSTDLRAVGGPQPTFELL